MSIPVPVPPIPVPPHDINSHGAKAFATGVLADPHVVSRPKPKQQLVTGFR